MKYTVSRNIFADLGLPDPYLLQIKADITQQIRNIIKDKKWSKKQAAQILGLDISVIRDFYEHCPVKYDINFLLEQIQSLGYNIELNFVKFTEDYDG